ncbi:MAG: S8 family serine peptidase [Xanthomonadales bacterium]|nr:S8 family serine peptidase [Xanthomonadales bacterium]
MTQKRTLKHFITLGTLAFSILPLVGTLQAAELIDRAGPEPILTSITGTKSQFEFGEIEVFVRLAEESVVAWVNGQVAQGLPEPSAEEQRAYAATLEQKQAEVSSQLASMGADELSSMRVGDNGLKVRIDASKIDAIRGIFGVTNVTKVTRHTPDLSRSVPWIGADVVQSDGNDGAGIVIAVIDTGVDYLHANLGGAGDPAEYAANDKDIIEPGTFPTAKVIGGWDFAGELYDGTNTPVPDPDPLDGHGHGSHVSGIAAGMGVPGTIGVGVAPGASIMALKVFGDIDGSTTLTSDAIEFALDPNGDGDTSDHVDVINMSLGSGYGDPNDPSAVSAHNAANMGVVVVASAGNSGDIPYITGSPAVGPDVVSVASSLSGGDTTGIDVDGTEYESVEGVSSVRIADGPFAGDLAVPADPANVFGCLPVADDMTGKIALISRGDCNFSLKHLNAQDAGAIGVVVYNDGTSPSRIAPIVMGGDFSGVTIPGTMISSFDGMALSGTLGAATLDDSIVTATVFGDTMSGFSSRGPSSGGSGFKPDLTAPGSAITSTLVGSGTGPLTIGGTSMAAPHVAGLGALILAANPTITPSGVKAMMQNSTITAVPDGLVGPPHAMARQGAGVVRAHSAVALTSYATPGGVSFGRINPKKKAKADVKVDLVNLSEDKRTFTVTHVPNQTFPGVEISCPKSVEVDKKGKKSKKSKKDNHHNKGPGDKNGKHQFKINLKMDPTAGPYDDGFQSQTEVDGWCVLNDGIDELRVAYMAVVDPASDMKAEAEDGVLSVENKKGGNVGWAEGFTLAGKDGLLLDKQFNAFKAVGFRSSSYAALGDLIEFGISSERIWENFSTAEIDIYVDVDGDGIDDAILVVADFFEDGIPVTAIFPQGSVLFDAGVDYNDGVTVLTFFSKTDAPLGFLGFLPAGDTDFDYTAVFFDVRSGEYDVQVGSVDLAAEIIPEVSSFGLSAGDKAELAVSGTGEMLWLYQNNAAKKDRTGKQSQTVKIK